MVVKDGQICYITVEIWAKIDSKDTVQQACSDHLIELHEEGANVWGTFMFWAVFL